MASHSETESQTKTSGTELYKFISSSSSSSTIIIVIISIINIVIVVVVVVVVVVVAKFFVQTKASRTRILLHVSHERCI